LVTVAKEFIGSAIVPEIIHHGFQGQRSAFLYTGHTLRYAFILTSLFGGLFQQAYPSLCTIFCKRFLFAEHFRPAMVYNLIGELQRRGLTDVEIVVVSPDALTISLMQQRIKDCKPLLSSPIQPGSLTFHSMSILQYASLRDVGLFDFIEYNGGLSKAIDPDQELAALKELLHTDTGVLGLTYFTHNHHTTRVRALVDARNTSFMVPFSLEATRLVHAYLDQHKLGLFKSDQELVIHLGGEEEEWTNVRYKQDHLVPRVQGRSLTKSQALTLITKAGLAVSSWVPTAYANPFGS